MEEIELDVHIKLSMDEVWICRKGTYDSCSYYIKSISEVGGCVQEYIKDYCSKEEK